MENIKNRMADLEREFANQSQQQVSELKTQLIYSNFGMSDDEFKKFKSDAKQTFAFEATPEEMEEAFKGFRV